MGETAKERIMVRAKKAQAQREQLTGAQSTVTAPAADTGAQSTITGATAKERVLARARELDQRHRAQGEKVSGWFDDVERFSQRMNGDFRTRKNQWQAADAFGQYRDKTGAEINELLKRARNSQSYYTQYGSVYDKQYGAGASRKLLDGISQNIKYLEGIRKNLQNEGELWGQFPDETSYTTWQGQAEQEAQKDPAAIREYQEKDLAELEEVKKRAVGLRNQMAYGRYDYGAGETPESVSEEYRQLKERQKALEQYVASGAKRYYETENEGRFAALEQDSGAAAGYASARELREELDRIERMGNALLGGPDPVVADQYDSDKKYLMDKYGVTQADIEAAARGRDTDSRLWALYDELKAQYEGQTAALAEQGYRFERMEGWQDRQEKEAARAEDQALWKREARENWGVSTLGTLVASPLQGVEYVGQMLGNVGHNDINDVENYVPLSTADMPITDYVATTRGEVAQMARENGAGIYATLATAGAPAPVRALVKDKLEERMKGTKAAEITGQVASFLYETGVSIAESAEMIALLGPGSVVFMGGSAAAQQTRNVIEQGGTNRQALVSGLAVGAAEVLFEKISLDNLLKPRTIAGWKDLLKAVVEQSGVEASEEMFTEVANILSDAAIMGGSSEFARSVERYVQDGKSREEATRLAFLDCVGQVGLAGLGGAVSGFAMGGTVSTANYFGTQAEISRLGEQLYASGVTGEQIEGLTARGLAADKKSRAYRAAAQAQARLQAGQALSDYELGMLYQAVAAYAAARGEVQVADNERSFRGAVEVDVSGDALGDLGPVGLARDDYVEHALKPEDATRIDRVARALGVRVRFVDSVRGGTANAQISGSEILVEKNNPNPVMFLLGHEFTHRLQELAPEQHRVFRDAIAQQVQDEARVLLKQYRDAGESISQEGAMDEAVANYAGRLIEGGKVLDEFIEKHRNDRTLLEKMRDAIRAIIAKLTGAERRKGQTAEGKLTAALEAAAQQAKDLEAEKNAAREGGEVRYSTKNDVLALDGVDWMDNFSSIKEQLKKHADEINKMQPVAVVEYATASGTQIVDMIMDGVSRIGGGLIKRGSVTFNFDKNGAASIKGHAKSPEEKAAALASPYVAKRGKLISGHRNHEGGGTTTLTYAAPVVINGETVNVGLVVQFTSDGRPHAVNVGLQDGGTFKIDTKKAPKGTNSRVYQYDKGTDLSTMGAFEDRLTQVKPDVKGRLSLKTDSEGRELTPEQAAEILRAQAVKAARESFGPIGVETFKVGFYAGSDPVTYFRDFMYAYESGRQGQAMDSVRRGSLTRTQLEAAWEAGRMDAGSGSKGTGSRAAKPTAAPRNTASNVGTEDLRRDTPHDKIEAISAEPQNSGGTGSETVTTGSSLLDQAIGELTGPLGTVSHDTAAELLRDVPALDLLKQQAGLTLENGMTSAQKRSEVKRAVKNVAYQMQGEQESVASILPRRGKRRNIGIQFFAKSSSEFPTIFLPKQEYAHVMSELATNLTAEQKKWKVIKKAIGKYIYTVEVNGPEDYRIIGKKKINDVAKEAFSKWKKPDRD